MDLVIAAFEDAQAWCRDYFHSDSFSFCFSYTAPESHFREIDRFLWESRHEKTRFANRYSGPVTVDISEWSTAVPNDYFDAFLYFLKDQAAECRIVMVSDKICTDRILSRLERFFPLKTTDLLGTKEKKRKSVAIGFAAREEVAEHV